MAGLAGHFIGIAQGGEIQQAALAGALPGGYRLFAGGAAKHHARVLVGEVIDIADGLVGL